MTSLALSGLLVWSSLVNEPTADEAGPSPATVELDWQAPDDCPSAEEIRARYEALLTRPVAGRGTMLAEGRVVREDDAWHLSLTTVFEGVRDERVLRAGTCDELGDATATVFAIVLEPGLMGAPEPERKPEPEPKARIPEAAPPPDPTPPPAIPPSSSPSPPPSVAEPEPQAETSSSLGGLLRPSLGVEYGALPGVTAWVGLAGALTWPRARLELETAWLTPRSAGGPRGSTATAQSVVAAMHGCYRARVAAVEFPLCAGIEGGVVRAVASGVPRGGVVRGPWLAPSARGAVARRWGRWGVYASVGVAPRLQATRLLVDDQVVFEPLAVSIRGLVGLEVFFSPDGS